MMKKQKSLRDVVRALEGAMEVMDEIERRSVYETHPALSFEQRVIHAVRRFDNGDPMKDYLNADDIEQAIKVLADIYTVTGVTMPEDWVG